MEQARSKPQKQQQRPLFRESPLQRRGTLTKRIRELHGLVAIPHAYAVATLGRPVLPPPQWRKVKGISFKNLVWIAALVEEVTGHRIKLHLISTPSLSITTPPEECQAQRLSDDFLEVLEPSGTVSQSRRNLCNTLPPAQELNEASILLHLEAQFGYRLPFCEFSESCLAWINDNMELDNQKDSNQETTSHKKDIDTEPLCSKYDSFQSNTALDYFKAALRSELSIEHLECHPFKILSRAFRSALRTGSRQFITFQGVGGSGKSRLFRECIIFHSNLMPLAGGAGTDGPTKPPLATVLPRLHSLLSSFTEYNDNAGYPSSSSAIRTSLWLAQDGTLKSVKYFVKRIVDLPRKANNGNILFTVWASWVVDAAKNCKLGKFVPGISASLDARVEHCLRGIFASVQKRGVGIDFQGALRLLGQCGLTQFHIRTIMQLTLASILLYSMTSPHQSYHGDTKKLTSNVVWSTVCSLVGVTETDMKAIVGFSDVAEEKFGWITCEVMLTKLATLIDNAIMMYMVRLVNFTIHETVVATFQRDAATEEPTLETIILDLIDIPGINLNRNNSIESYDVLLANYLSNSVDLILEESLKRSVKYLYTGNESTSFHRNFNATNVDSKTFPVSTEERQDEDLPASTEERQRALEMFNGNKQPYGIITDVNNRGYSVISKSIKSDLSYCEMFSLCQNQERIISRNVRTIAKADNMRRWISLKKSLPPKDTETVQISHPFGSAKYCLKRLVIEETATYPCLKVLERLGEKSQLPHCSLLLQTLFSKEGVWTGDETNGGKVKFVDDTIIGDQSRRRRTANSLSSLPDNEIAKLCQKSAGIIRIATDIRRRTEYLVMRLQPNTSEMEKENSYGRPWNIICLQTNPHQSSAVFDSQHVCSQLQSLPVVEEIEIGRSALEIACHVDDFYARFSVLSRQVLDKYGVLPSVGLVHTACAEMLKKLLRDNEAFHSKTFPVPSKKQFHVTPSTIYLRTSLYELLEGMKNLIIRKENNAAIAIQMAFKKQLAKAERKRCLRELDEKKRALRILKQKTKEEYLMSLSKTLYFNIKMLIQRKRFLTSRLQIIRIQRWWRDVAAPGYPSEHLALAAFMVCLQGYAKRLKMMKELESTEVVSTRMKCESNKRKVVLNTSRLVQKLENMYISSKVRKELNNSPSARKIIEKRIVKDILRRLVALRKMQLYSATYKKLRRSAALVQQWFRQIRVQSAAKRITRFMNTHFGSGLRRQLEFRLAEKQCSLSLITSRLDSLVQIHIQDVFSPAHLFRCACWYRHLYSLGKTKLLLNRVTMVPYAQLFRAVCDVGDIRYLRLLEDMLKLVKNDSLAPVVGVAASEFRLLSLHSDGTVQLAGSKRNEKQYGFLPKSLELTNKVLSMAAGKQHYLFVTSHGKVYSAGGSAVGALGQGQMLTELQKPKEIENLSHIVKVSAGLYHSVFLSQGGNLLVCGKSVLCGMLDPSESKIKWRPVYVPHFKHSKMEDISAGFYHTVAMEETGHVWTFGSNQQGQLGTRHFVTPYEVPRRVTLQINGLSEPFLLAAKVSCGAFHTTCISHSGKVFTWGWTHELRNDETCSKPQPLLTPPPRAVSVKALMGVTLILLEDGRIFRAGTRCDLEPFNTLTSLLDERGIVPRELFGTSSRWCNIGLLGTSIKSSSKAFNGTQ